MFKSTQLRESRGKKSTTSLKADNSKLETAYLDSFLLVEGFFFGEQPFNIHRAQWSIEGKDNKVVRRKKKKKN